MPRAKQAHTCERCGKTFASKQGKYSHRTSVKCQAVPVGAGVVEDASVAPVIKDAMRLLFDDIPQRPSDRAIERFSASMANLFLRRGEVAVDVSVSGAGDGRGAAGVVVNVTINNYRCVSTDYVDHCEMVRLIKARNLRESLQRVVELLHFNPEHPENMNAYLSNALAEHGYTYAHGRWTMKPRDDLAKGVMLNAGSLMNEHNDDPYTRDFTHAETARFDRFYSVFDVEREPLRETIETIVNRKGHVETAHPELRTLIDSRRN